MMKRIALLCSTLLAGQIQAQDTTSVKDLQQINASAKNAYVKVEQLDQLQHDLNYFDEHPVTGPDRQQLLLDTYRTIANGYASNNHFKQGYGVYQKYLTIKEKFLAAEKTEAVAKSNKDIDEKQHQDSEEQVSIQSQVQQLQLDNDHLQSKRKSFKHYFSLGIIGLTVIFAFLLLQAGLQLNKIKQELKTGRERLMQTHRIASLGKLITGAREALSNALASLKKNSSDAILQTEQLSRHEEKKSEWNLLRKQLNTLKGMSDFEV